jgi:cytoskeletal protein CcmA (bactofilin family)
MSPQNQPTGPRQRRRFTDGEVACETIVAAGVSILGELRGRSGIELKGTIEGIIDVEGLLWLRPGARVTGNISAIDVLVEGEVVGDISAREKIELGATSRVIGDLRAQALAIADGGFFEGHITMAGSPGAREAVTFQEKRSATD